MEDSSPLSSQGAGDPKLSPSTIQSERDVEVRRVRVQEQSDPVTSAPIRVKKEDISNVPRKVPRFQYVDFPSLHQCIQQLTVPPLDNWLAGCPLVRAPGRTPASPKERVPKFKYVDYPSLHHCIQQLSVPPLESWSSGLARPRMGGGAGALVGLGVPFQPGSVRVHAAAQGGGIASARKRERITAFPFPSPDPALLQRLSTPTPAPLTPQLPARHLGTQHRAAPPASTGGGGVTFERVHLDTLSQKSSDSRAPDRTTVRLSLRDKRPSVISLHPDRELHQTQPEVRPERRHSPDSARVVWKTVPELVCPFCQQMFADPEELRVHQRSHRDKRPH